MNKIILALDTTNLEEAINTTKKIKNKIFTVKLGLEFFNAHGKSGIKEFNKIGINNLMLDLKLKDIPETVYRAIKALDDIKFDYLTIHGQGGKKLIESAKRASNEIKSRNVFGHIEEIINILKDRPDIKKLNEQYYFGLGWKQ